MLPNSPEFRQIPLNNNYPISCPRVELSLWLLLWMLDHDWKSEMKLEIWILCFREIGIEIGVLQVIAPWSDHQNIGSRTVLEIFNLINLPNTICMPSRKKFSKWIKYKEKLRLGSRGLCKVHSLLRPSLCLVLTHLLTCSNKLTV